MTFTQLLERVCAQRKKQPFQGCLLALDPGETTGWAVFKRGELVESGQLPCEGAGGFLTLANLIDYVKPSIVVCEAYRVYSHKRDEHVWSDLYTVRLIGSVELSCIRKCIHLYFQMASTAKGFCKDEKLKQWGYYKRGERHARDAIRHGCYWLLFGKADY